MTGEFPPLINQGSVLKGFIAGSLIAGSFILSFLVIQILLFIIGVVIFLDASIPENRKTYVLETMIFLIFGALVSLFFCIVGLCPYYLTLTILIFLFLYYKKLKLIAKKLFDL